MCLLGSRKDQKKKKLLLTQIFAICYLVMTAWSGVVAQPAGSLHAFGILSSHRMSIENTLLKHESIFLIADILVANFEGYQLRN